MRLLFILFASIMTTIVLVGCQDDSAARAAQGTGDDDAPAETFFLADIEGMALEANSISILEISIEGVPFIEIVAENTNTDEVLRLLIPKDVPIGSYPMASLPVANAVYGTYRPNRDVEVSTFVSTSGLFNLSQKNNLPLSISGNTVFAMVNEQGNVDEVTFCEFVLSNE
jgi:hypothetical protein